MEPGYPPHTVVRVTRLPLSLVGLGRGDVVVIRSPEARVRLELKRVVGLPGETIRWTAHRFVIADRVLDEPYARLPRPVPGDDEARERRLGPGDYFVAGDNRLHSRDSRHYGPVRRRAIVGKVVAASMAGAHVRC